MALGNTTDTDVCCLVLYLFQTGTQRTSFQSGLPVKQPCTMMLATSLSIENKNIRLVSLQDKEVSPLGSHPPSTKGLTSCRLIQTFLLPAFRTHKGPSRSNWHLTGGGRCERKYDALKTPSLSNSSFRSLFDLFGPIELRTTSSTSSASPLTPNETQKKRSTLLPESYHQPRHLC